MTRSLVLFESVLFHATKRTFLNAFRQKQLACSRAARFKGYGHHFAFGSMASYTQSKPNSLLCPFLSLRSETPRCPALNQVRGKAILNYAADQFLEWRYESRRSASHASEQLLTLEACISLDNIHLPV